VSSPNADSAASGTVTTPNAVAVEPPPVQDAPDLIAASVHQPGKSPTQTVLDGPAVMTVGARNKSGKSGKKTDAKKS
jgi:hypothetical protein